MRVEGKCRAVNGWRLCCVSRPTARGRADKDRSSGAAELTALVFLFSLAGTSAEGVLLRDSWGRAASFALMGFGFDVERFGLFLRMVVNQPATGAQRAFPLWLGVGLLTLGAGVAVVSALQLRAVVRGLGEKEIRGNYRTQLGVWLKFILALVVLALVIHLVAGA